MIQLLGTSFDLVRPIEGIEGTRSSPSNKTCLLGFILGSRADDLGQIVYNSEGSMDFVALKAAILQERMFVTAHADIELVADALEAESAWASMLAQTAEIVEDYPEDRRGPSCLILSFVSGRPVHTVIAYPASRVARLRQLPDVALMITAYRPDSHPHEWSSDYRSRLSSP